MVTVHVAEHDHARHPLPILKVVGEEKLTFEDRHLVERAIDKIGEGVTSFWESNPGVQRKTAEDYAAIYNSAASFTEAKAALLKLATRNRTNTELNKVAMEAARMAADMEESAIIVEQAKRPGTSVMRDIRLKLEVGPALQLLEGSKAT